MSLMLRRLLPKQPWLLLANDGRQKHVVTIPFDSAREERAEAFLSAHEGHEVKMLAGKPTHFFFRMIDFDDIKEVVAIGIRLPLERKAALNSLQRPPAICFQHKGSIIAAWRFETPVSVTVASKAEEFLARHFRGERLNFFIPIGRMMPYDIFIDPKRVEDVVQEKENDRTTKRKFTRGDEDDDEDAAREVHENWLASENFTFYVGRPKQGKSLAVAKTASYITAGGSWDGNGRWTDKWFDGAPIEPHARGSVIILEEEDPTAQTKARCRVAGCDMSKVHIRKLVPHISVKEQLSEITDLAEQLGDCRMISFSPVQSAIKARDAAEPVVRGEFRPLLNWATGRGIALVGILHTTKDGKALAGSDVLFRIARCVVAFEDGVMEVRDSNIGPSGMTIPFKVETVISKGVKTARICFVDWRELDAQEASSKAPMMGVTDKAEYLIRELLNGGPLDSAKLRERVLAEGVSVGAFLDAKKRVFGEHGTRGKKVTLSLS